MTANEPSATTVPCALPEPAIVEAVEGRQGQLVVDVTARVVSGTAAEDDGAVLEGGGQVAESRAAGGDGEARRRTGRDGQVAARAQVDRVDAVDRPLLGRGRAGVGEGRVAATGQQGPCRDDEAGDGGCR